MVKTFLPITKRMQTSWLQSREQLPCDKIYACCTEAPIMTFAQKGVFKIPPSPSQMLNTIFRCLHISLTISHLKSTLFCKFHCIFVYSRPCLQFDSLQRHLKHHRSDLSEEHKWYKARIQAYLHRRIRFCVNWKRLEHFTFFKKGANFVFSKLKVC